jgi:hypothetical protein
MTADTFRIVARGNAYTSRTTVQDYALLKAAETTIDAGGSHFVVISAADASRAGAFTTPSTIQTTVSGGTAYSTYTPGSTTTFIKPGQDTYIRIVRLNAGERPPPGAYPVDEIVQFIGSRAKRPA